MRTRSTRRAVVLALLGAFLCALVWIATAERGRTDHANIGKLSATVTPLNEERTASVRVVLTNRGAGNLQLGSIILQLKEPDGTWMDYSHTSLSNTLSPGGSQVVLVRDLKRGAIYRPSVSYYCELTGLRRWTKRAAQVVKKRKLDVLWSSAAHYRYGQAIGEESRF